MRKLRLATLALALASTPTALHAQDGWWDWSLRELSVRVDFRTSSAPRYVPDVVHAPGPRPGARIQYHDYEPRYHDYGPRDRAHGRKSKGKKGPAFCRSGAGHPVHGRRWCVDKGFGLDGPAYGPVRWERRYWRQAIPRVPRRHPLRTLGHRELIGFLGPAVYGRLDRERARLGGHHALSGRWFRPHGTSLVLQIRSGPVAVAELTDFGGDGLIDVVLVAGR